MAIYDNDGTANHEIGKLYDNDGTANHQISKVYDWDGTANHLIYTGTPEYLYNKGDQYTADTGGWQDAGFYVWYGNTTGNTVELSTQSETMGTCSLGSGGILLQGGNTVYSGQAARTKNKVDLTDIKSLVMTYTMTTRNWSDNYMYAHLAVASTLKTSSAGAANNSGKTYRVSLNGLTVGKNYTITLDVSDLSGSYYVIASNSHGNGYWTAITVKTIKCVS